MPNWAITSIEVSVVIASVEEVRGLSFRYSPDQVLPRRRRIPPCLREDAVGQPERELDQQLVAPCGELVERVSAVEEGDVAIEPFRQGVAADVACHLLDDRHELGQPQSLEPGRSLLAPAPRL